MKMTSVSRDMFDQYMVPNYSPAKVIPVRGEGSRVWDQDNRCYIDFGGGIAVTALGHAYPPVVEALKKQADSIWHLSNIYTNEPALSLASKLCEATFAEKVFLCNSGGEANEAGLKLARRYASDNFDDSKHEIIAFDDSFHGRTFFTVSVGGQPKYTEGFGPLPAGITHLPLNDIEALRSAISTKTCAVIVEPIQGEGGVRSCDKDFLQAARELCDEHNALLIFDEVQCGMGRTGSLYAYMDYDVVPDILTTAKALGCGFPVAAMLTTEKVAASMVVGTHGSTYGGNPLASAVASTVLDIINDPELLAGVSIRRSVIDSKLNDINFRYPLFDEIRGKGLLIGWVLKAEFSGKARDILNAAMEEQLFILVAGPDVIRMAPSLIISEADLEEGLNRLENAVAAVFDSLQ
ncbi:MAG: succinylornithine transaminase family protein [Parasphingorhabdus sp.]|jgi:succinylornithine transaminase family protein